MANALEGVSELVAQLKALGALEDGKALSGACRAGMKPVYDEAVKTITVGHVAHRLAKQYGRQLVAPGFAKSQIRLARRRFESPKASAFVTTTKRAFYALRWLETGSSKMAAQPWLRPALYSQREAVETAFADSLRKFVLKAAAKK